MDKWVLGIGAHPDDIECGAAGTLHRLQREGYKIEYVVFALCNYFPQERIIQEVGAATKSWDRTSLFNFPVNKLPEHAADIRFCLENIKVFNNPEIVFCPSTTDIHQDHAIVSLSCRQVFRDSTILGYESYKSGNEFIPNVYFEIDSADLSFKFNVLSIYKTQRKRFAPFSITSLAPYRGVAIAKPFAEAFECIRIVNKI